MLQLEEIKRIIQDDSTSDKKRLAKKGQAYYQGEHDILQYRLFYYNADGNLVEDKTRSNTKIPHPFFTELVDQATQYMLSGKDGFVKSDNPGLQKELDKYFNDSEDFQAELAELLTGCMSKGFEYMYAYKNANDKISFMCADSIGVIEVEARFASDEKDHVIYWYIDRIDKEKKKIKRIMDWDSQQTFYYVQADDGKIKPDNCFNGSNSKPHILYKEGYDENTYYDGFGFIPFFRLDNNKKQISDLKTIKPLIDDYDLMASSLSNNLVDFDTPIHVVKGFEGDSLDELQQNLKTKKIIGMESTDAGAGVEIKTVDVPFEARKVKLELDEKNIYRFGFGLNTQGLKDTSATTNIAIKAAYSLLDLKKSKLEIRLKQFLRKLLKPVLDEINAENKTDYESSDVYFEFNPEIMSNAQENAQIELTDAQKKQVIVNILLSVAQLFDDETIMINLCDVLEIDYEEIKDKLPKSEEENTMEAQNVLNGVVTDERQAEGNLTITT